MIADSRPIIKNSVTYTNIRPVPFFLILIKTDIGVCYIYRAYLSRSLIGGTSVYSDNAITHMFNRCEIPDAQSVTKLYLYLR